MQQTGTSIKFSTSEQALGLPAEIHVNATIGLVNEIEDRRAKIYDAACQPSAPGIEAESRSAAFNYATDLGTVARRLMQVAGLDDLVFVEE